MTRWRIRILTMGILTTAMLGGSFTTARADEKTQAARKLTQYLLKKFAKEAAEEGAETLTGRIAKAASRHGDDVFRAVKRVGPKALALADDAGAHGAKAMNLVARYGDDAAVWILRRPKAMNLVARYGDDAAKVLIKHKGVAEPVLDALGAPALQALAAVGPQNGRRLAMMAQGGELATLGRTPELMNLLTRHGDRAMDFVWRNKGALAVGTTLTAFLTHPEPFLEGTQEIAGLAATHVAAPVAQGVGAAIERTAEQTAHIAAWPLAALLTGGGAVLAVRLLKHGKHGKAGGATPLRVPEESR